MYKVLLVDDELLDLEGLRRFVDWEGLGLRVGACACSGFEALEALAAEHFDILVTDIRMPIMSGMELARRALEWQKGLKIVFVSGYEDFGYAKQAIAMNAFGYVLKPVDDTDMGRALADVRKALDYECACSRLEREMSESEPLLKRELLMQLLDGGTIRNGDDMQSQLQQLGTTWRSPKLYTALLAPDDLFSKLEDLTDQDVLTHERELEEVVELFCSSEQQQCCKLDRFRYALILEAAYDSGRLHRLIEDIKQGTVFTATIGVGPVAKLEELSESFSQAEEALKLKLFLGKGRLIRHTDGKGAVQANEGGLDELIQVLFQAVSAYRLVAVDECVEALFSRAEGLEDKLDIFQLILHVVAELDHCLNSLNEDFYGLLGLDRRQLNILYRYETISEMKSWLRGRMFELSEQLQRKRHGKKHKLVEEIEAYIEARLDQNVLLRDAAEHFSFSPNHLGQIFYGETGVYFSDYVTRRRLERAKELLGDPKLKVYEVAHRVGYRNLSHFSKQFKEHYSMSPGDYRRHL